MTVPHSTDPADLYGPDETAAGQENDGTFLWLATGDLPDGENPYAPEWAWPRLIPHLRPGGNGTAPGRRFHVLDTSKTVPWRMSLSPWCARRTGQAWLRGA